jgi:hypothetical protein
VGDRHSTNTAGDDHRSSGNGFALAQMARYHPKRHLPLHYASHIALVSIPFVLLACHRADSLQNPGPQRLFHSNTPTRWMSPVFIFGCPQRLKATRPPAICS